MASIEGYCDEEKEKDRISELPRHVVDCIFDRMSIHEVARTSILSRNWRYIWASYPRIVFDENFFKEINVKHKEFIRYEFPKAICNALFVHSGPILKFFLHIPSIPNDLSPDIDRWMLVLSRNGIRNLELENKNLTPYVLPSCIFSCSLLTNLRLRNCVLKPPCTFRGFYYLINLVLSYISFSSTMFATLLQNAPVLKALSILGCTGIELRSIHVPKLKFFSILKSDKVDWQWFESNKQLTDLQLELRIEVKNIERNVSMMKFLKHIPKIRNLCLNGFSLKYLAAGSPPQSLATPSLSVSDPFNMRYIKSVRLRYFGVDDLDQISSAICLLKSSPNLKILELDFAASNDNVTEPVIGYLEPTNCVDMNLNMLQTVNIRLMKGLKAELLFIKLLLARATCLQRMMIELGSAIGASDGLKISTELLRFPRASSSAEIIYVVPCCS